MAINRQRIVTIRKPRVCDGCYRKFQPGIVFNTVALTQYDSIVTWYECPTCYELLRDYREYFGDGDLEVTSGCVQDLLAKEQTPEQLLESLKNGQMP